MSRQETNRHKRAEIAAQVARLRAGGWSALQIAVRMRVSVGTVYRWANARSMGKNYQRRILANFPDAPSED